MTFVRYLTRLRLDQASALLARPGARVQEVARQVGYAGVRHFSRLFRQQFGCLPSQYLRKRTSRGGEV
jgi:two-component system response regulator YesN